MGIKDRALRVIANTPGMFRKTGIPIILSNKHITKKRSKAGAPNKVGVGGKGLHKIRSSNVVYSVRRLNSGHRVFPSTPRGKLCVFSRSTPIKRGTITCLKLSSDIIRCRVASGHMSYFSMLNVTHRTTTAFRGRFMPPIMARAKGGRSIGSCVGMSMGSRSLYDHCATEIMGGVGFTPSPG